MAIVKVLRRERADGFRLAPGAVVELPDALAARLEALGAVRRMSRAPLTSARAPAGARVLYKLPEEG